MMGATEASGRINELSLDYREASSKVVLSKPQKPGKARWTEQNLSQELG